MKVVIYNNKEKKILELPINVEGSFTLADNNQNQIISINSSSNGWVMTAASGFSLMQNSQALPQTLLSEHSYYVLKSDNDKLDNYIVYTEPDCDNSFKVFSVEKNMQISIGSDNTNDIIYNNPYLSPKHAIIQYDDTGFKLIVLNNGITFLNDIIMTKPQTVLHSSDIVMILGLKIIIAGDYLIINTPNNLANFNGKLKEITIPYNTYEKANNENKPFPIKKEEYFFKKPRIRRYIKTADISIASPPQKVEQEETPLILVIGPMLTMGIISFVSIINTIIRILNKQTTFSNSWTTFITSGVMLMAMLLWPMLTRRYQKKKAERKEKRRVKKYREYIERKKSEIANICLEQTQILKELYLTTGECCKIIENKTFIYRQVLNKYNKRIHGPIDSWDEERQIKASIIIDSDKF